MLCPRRPIWMMLLTPAVVGSLAAVMVLANVSTARRFFRGQRVSLPVSGSRDRMLLRLRTAILGNGKRRIASMLGPPRVTQAGAEGTWYYSLNQQEHLAIAISFDHGLAKEVEYVQSPA